LSERTGSADLAILTATYNEAGNIEALIAQLRAIAPEATLAVVDDASSDGTAEILARLQASDPKLVVIGRPGKLGIGSAHKDGIRWAYAAGCATLVTMDADFTHIPADVPRMLAAAEGKDVAIGSRFALRESLETWSMFRRIVTRAAHLATRVLLGIPYDCSGSFRVYRLEAIPESFWDRVEADDYGFFFESLYRLHAAGHPIAQIPILLPARASGSSKMSPRDAVSGLAHLMGFAWRMRRRLG
jgi:dolichol-phosphate mannosyltransferase